MYTLNVPHTILQRKLQPLIRDSIHCKKWSTQTLWVLYYGSEQPQNRRPKISSGAFGYMHEWYKVEFCFKSVSQCLHWVHGPTLVLGFFFSFNQSPNWIIGIDILCHWNLLNWFPDLRSRVIMMGKIKWKPIKLPTSNKGSKSEAILKPRKTTYNLGSGGPRWTIAWTKVSLTRGKTQLKLPNWIIVVSDTWSGDLIWQNLTSQFPSIGRIKSSWLSSAKAATYIFSLPSGLC